MADHESALGPVLVPESVPQPGDVKSAPAAMGRIIEVHNPSNTNALLKLGWGLVPGPAVDSQGNVELPDVPRAIPMQRVPLEVLPGARVELGFILVPEGPSHTFVDTTQRYLRIESNGSKVSEVSPTATSIHYATVMNRGDRSLRMALYYTQQVALPGTLPAAPKAIKAAHLTVDPLRGFGLELLIEPAGEGVSALELQGGV